MLFADLVHQHFFFFFFAVFLLCFSHVCAVSFWDAAILSEVSTGSNINICIVIWRAYCSLVYCNRATYNKTSNLPVQTEVVLISTVYIENCCMTMEWLDFGTLFPLGNEFVSQCNMFVKAGAGVWLYVWKLAQTMWAKCSGIDKSCLFFLVSCIAKCSNLWFGK